MLDVHVLVSNDTRQDWVAQSLASVRDAISRADYPIELHVLNGVPGHIGKGRAKAYSLGSAPWKTYVDDDDYVLPNAFVDLKKYLDKDVAAVFTSERIWQNGNFHPYIQPEHHLQVYRDDLVRGFDHDMVCMSDVYCRELAKRDPRGFLSVEDVTYVHRVYWDSKARKLRRENPQEATKLMKEFR